MIEKEHVSHAANGHDSVHWALIQGEWEIGESGAVFKGGAEKYIAHGQSFPMGLAISNRALQSGRCGVNIKFDKTAEDAHFAGGLVIGFRSPDRYYVQVQLGAAKMAYAVSEFLPGFGWRPVQAVGPLSALHAGTSYRLEAEIQGQELRVRVDGVQVLEVILSRPLEGKQTGLTAAGENGVNFSGFEVFGSKPRVFVAMEYREPFDTFYREVIKPQADQRFEVVRIDEKVGPGVIFQDMQREIAQADIVIAEITPPNLNVFYELGYAHALGKPTILLAQRGGALPFDIKSFRVVFYDDSIGGKSKIERDLSKHLEAISESLG